MAFHNVRLDTDISYGFEGGPGFSTTIQTTASGHEYRIGRQAQMRHRYRARKELLTPAQFAILKSFYAGRRGALHGFRFKDWQDFTTNADGIGTQSNLDVTLGVGDASETDYQLIKVYDFGGVGEYARVISLPVAGSVTVALDGVPTSAYTLSNPGGVITFSSPPGMGVSVQAGCEFDTPVRFALTVDEWMTSSLTSFQRIEAPLEMQEILDEIEWPEVWWPGGSSGTVATSLDIVLSANVRLWTVNPGIAGLSAFLPPPDRIPGGEVFVFHVLNGAAGNITVRDDAGSAVTGSLGSNTTRRIALSRSGSTTAWVAY